MKTMMINLIIIWILIVRKSYKDFNENDNINNDNKMKD